MSKHILAAINISQTFYQGGCSIEILKDISFKMAKGEIVALTGPSGCGKSSLLHIAGLLERPDRGNIEIDGRSCLQMNDRERTHYRLKVLGFVYQAHHLLPEFTALENVMIPILVAGKGRRLAKEYALELFERLDLESRQDHRPKQLSGGEQQRVAIARALANNPAIILADEPTGNLDPGNAEAVFSALLFAVRETGLSALIATHNAALTNEMDRELVIKDGVICE